MEGISIEFDIFRLHCFFYGMVTADVVQSIQLIVPFILQHPPPVIVSPAEVGAASKTVKIIKVKVEKGTNLQELAKELTRKIKEERDKQQAPRQQRAPLTAASSLKVSTPVIVCLLMVVMETFDKATGVTATT